MTQPKSRDSQKAITQQPKKLPYSLQSFNNLPIGTKLSISFGILATLTVIVVGLIFLASQRASQNIRLTQDLSVPAALASAQAQSSLLEMQASVRG
jgi:CHASE3 domain sensor protein